MEERNETQAGYYVSKHMESWTQLKPSIAAGYVNIYCKKVNQIGLQRLIFVKQIAIES